MGKGVRSDMGCWCPPKGTTSMFAAKTDLLLGENIGRLPRKGGSELQSQFAILWGRNFAFHTENLRTYSEGPGIHERSHQTVS